jgi:hypothetical protein
MFLASDVGNGPEHSWFAQNYQWVFSGIGVFLISGVIWLLRRRSGPPMSEAQSPKGIVMQGNLSNTNSPMASGTHVTQTVNYHLPASEMPPSVALPIQYRSSPSPAEITQRIFSLPSFEQITACQSYEGLAVCWNVLLNEVAPPDADGVSRVYLTFEPGTYLVCCDLKISENPRLKTAYYGEPLEVRGVIEKLLRPNRVVVNLKDASVMFL